jgi:hypothetical protein
VIDGEGADGITRGVEGLNNERSDGAGGAGHKNKGAMIRHHRFRPRSQIKPFIPATHIMRALLEIVIPPRAGHFSTLHRLASLQRRNSRFALKQSSLPALR